MLLNKKKFINKEKKPISLFFNFPILSSTSYSQTFIPQMVVNEIKIVHNDFSTNSFEKSFRFKFFKSLNSFFLLKRFEKTSRRFKNLKNFLAFSNVLSKTKELHNFFILRSVKGGFIVVSLGLASFMPRSLFKIKNKNYTSKSFQKIKNKLFLLKIKVLKRRKKFSPKNRLRINIVSSRKKK